ncbi:MAG TPA: lactonase family protein [Bryobacteraceae bacterium]|jgi:6-phosphogluconolactonase|nr:lactonase family protein [Bryobacteraceae bacterium]
MRLLCLVPLLITAVSGVLPAASPAAGKLAKEYLVYFGTYTDKGSKGIYVCRFRPSSGKLTAVELAAETPNPSFLAVDPASRYLFAANETGDFQGAKTGSVSSFVIDRHSGKLRALNTVASHGTDPCHLTVDKAGTHVLVANYSSGSVAVLPVKADGMLGEASDVKQHLGSSVDPERQKEPHAHNVILTPDNRFAVVADLGLDKLLVYRFDPAAGTLTPNDPPYGSVKPGSGPRHIALHPNGRYAYVISEMGNTITAFDWDGERGSFNELQSVRTLPKDFKGENTTAEIAIHPSGRFLYGSNRGHDSIAVYAIDPANGKLTFVEDVATLGKEPRNFALDPTGAYLFAANQNSNTVVVFRINPKNGRLTPAGEKLDVFSPVCVTFVAAE